MHSLIRIGLIGVGRHGIRYARHLAQGDIPGAILTAIWRRDLARLEKDALSLGPNVRAAPTIESLIDGSEVDAVVSAVPAISNVQVALAAASAGKPLLIEKPIARTVHEGARIVAAFADARRPLMVAQTLRFDPLVVRLRARLEEIGGLRGFTFEQRIEPRELLWEDDPDASGGGVLMQTAIHTLDALRFVTQSDRLRVLSASTARMHYERNEDHALVELELGPGDRIDRTLIGHVGVSKIGRARRVRFALLLDTCALEADLVQRRFTETTDRHEKTISLPDDPTVVAALRAFVACLEGRGPNPIPGEDALRSLALVEAAYARARTP